MKNLQSHLFLDYGAMGGSSSSSSFRLWDLASAEKWVRFSSLTCGLGVALRLGPHSRAELNYCLPLTNGKFSVQGVRFGIGVNIL